MKVLKDHYYRLASEVPLERLEAATELMQELTASDSKVDWVYAVNRLVSGLVSTRQSARFGFSMALSEAVRELVPLYDDGYTEFTLEYFFDLIQASTTVKAAVKGRDERALLFGRLFGFQAIINSKLLLNQSLIDSLHNVGPRIIQSLVELLVAKSWLRETAIFTVCNFIKEFNSDQCSLSEETREFFLMEILQNVNDAGINQSSEGVAIFLSIPSTKRQELASRVKHPKGMWKNGCPLGKGNLPSLTKALMDTAVVCLEQEPSKPKSLLKQKGSWSPNVPFVWNLIFANFNQQYEASVYSEFTQETEAILPEKKRKKHYSHESTKRKQGHSHGISFPEFWRVVVDESLFADKASPERKYWGFEIMILYLKAVSNPENTPYLFTPNLMRCLINQSALPQRMLHKIARKVLETIESVCKSNILMIPVVAERLLNESVGGCWNFDLVSKSKTIDKLFAIVGTISQDLQNSHNLHTVLTNLSDLLDTRLSYAFSSQDKGDGGLGKKYLNDQMIRWSLDKSLVLVRNCKNFQTDPLLVRPVNKFFKLILKTLIQCSFYTRESQHPSLSIREFSRERLNSVFLEVIHFKIKGQSWPWFCVQYYEKLLVSSKFKTVVELDEEIEKIKIETLTILSSIDKILSLSSDVFRSDQIYCFELLFSMSLILLLLGDEEAILVLRELRMCYEDTFGSHNDAGSGDRSQNASIALTEIILTFLSRKSAGLKKLSMTVWETFMCATNTETGTSRLSKECLQLLYNVIEARENKQGQQTLFDNDNEFDAKDSLTSDGEANEDLNSDEEKENGTNLEEKNSVDIDPDNESSSSDEPGSDESSFEKSCDESSSTVDKETNLKLALALGLHVGETGATKFDALDCGSEDSSSQDSMDDDEMMAMDDQLCQIFKQRHDILASVNTGNKRKAEVTEARESMIFFKSRTLDLLEAFFRLQPTSILTVTAIQPLLTLIKLTLDKSLAAKAHRILKSRIGKTKLKYHEIPEKKSDFPLMESLIASLKSVQKEAAQSKLQMYLQACQQASMILAKTIVATDISYKEKVLAVYYELLKDWSLNKKNQTNPVMFFDLVNWLNATR